MKGIYTALVTPFQQDDTIDWNALDRLIEHQVDLGVDGLVICGTTGESPTLTTEEKIQLFIRAKKRVGNRLDLVAGTGSNCTRETIALTRSAENFGYSQFLIVTPYYNKPNQTGLVRHFQAVADSIRGEIILYNVPGRTSVSLSAKSIAQLAMHPRITSLKEATGNLSFLTEIVNELKATGAQIDLLSGDDATFLPFIRGGGVGTISVASHLLARPMKEMMKSAVHEPARADLLQDQWMPLFKDLFADTNPAPIKYCLSELGLIRNHLRLPLVPVASDLEMVLQKHLKDWKASEAGVAK